ncbi:MAG: HAD-IIIA family hydrolase [Proteobacteria bacterium]|nr:HAD-IIIA family hydrolase [Pseudomonadota bacterium]
MRKQWDAVLFDFDGTLVDSAPDIIAALNLLLGELGQEHVDYHAFRTRAGDGARNLLEQVLTSRGASFDDAELPGLVERLLTHYFEIMTDNTRPYPAVPDILAEIYQSGMALAICTNRTQATTDQLLSHFGLTQMFGAVLCADTVTAKKPDARHLFEAIERLGAAPERTIMVGDTATDVAAARNAGIKVVAVSYGYSARPAADLGADAVLADFAGLPALLAGLD